MFKKIKSKKNKETKNNKRKEKKQNKGETIQKIMIALASALPAILCSIAIIMTLLMLDKLSARDAILLIIVVILLGFVPIALDYLFNKKMPGDLTACLTGKKKAPAPAPVKSSMPMPMPMPRAPMVMSKQYTQSPAGPATIQTPTKYFPGAMDYYPESPMNPYGGQALPQVSEEDDYLKVAGL